MIQGKYIIIYRFEKTDFEGDTPPPKLRWTHNAFDPVYDSIQDAEKAIEEAIRKYASMFHLTVERVKWLPVKPGEENNIKSICLAFYGTSDSPHAYMVTSLFDELYLDKLLWGVLHDFGIDL